MIFSYSRGHKIFYEDNIWRYCDNNKIIDENRECKRCGCKPTKEGYDSCLGYIEGAISACCGHGVENSLILKNTK